MQDNLGAMNGMNHTTQYTYTIQNPFNSPYPIVFLLTMYQSRMYYISNLEPSPVLGMRVDLSLKNAK